MRRAASALTALAALLALTLAACSSGSVSKSAGGAAPKASAATSGSASASATPTPSPTPKPTPTIPPPRWGPGPWTTAVAHKGRPEVQTATVSVLGSTVVLLRTDAITTKLVLHAGYEDPGGDGWPAGSAISEPEKATLMAAFNGGFRLNLGLGGFSVQGRTFGAITPGLASVVTYTDGTSDIGQWGTQVPNARKRVYSVRQNLTMLVNNGVPAADIDSYGPWGATLGGGFAVARSGMGIDRFGNLIYAGSTYATRGPSPRR